MVATSNYPGSANRALAMKTVDRLRHTWVLGPTGSGKSWLLANMALQDIAAGRGLLLLDPKGDLVADVLARLPKDRMADVIVMDASATDQPVGFNILQAGASEHERELVVDHIVHVFSELWRSSWGPRTSDVLRNGLLTLVNARANEGSAFALTELPELLQNPAFRRFVLGQAAVPASVRGFWQQYERMSDAERAQVIGPSMNKIRALTTRTALRLCLGQSGGVQLAELFTKNKIVLVSLAKGQLGRDTADLLGSLLVANLWQVTLARSAVPAERRRPVFAYLDEFQDVLRLSGGGDLGDMLAQARGLALGLVLAHQYLDQLPAALKTAVLGTVRSQIVFALEHDDAKAMERRFAPALTAADLTGLEAHEVAARLCVDATTQSPVTGVTLPLDEPVHDAQRLAFRSRSQYGVARAEVEASLAARIQVSDRQQPIGRTRRMDEA